MTSFLVSFFFVITPNLSVQRSKMNYRAWYHRCWLVSYMTAEQVRLFSSVLLYLKGSTRSPSRTLEIHFTFSCSYYGPW